MERTGDDARARETLLKIALTCHLAFDFEGADEAWRRACTLPRDAMQAPPTERLEIATLKPQDIDPVESYEVATNWFARNLYRGLLKIERDLNVVPELAEEIRVSPDGRIYCLRIREGAVWSDGVAVVAADFVSAREALVRGPPRLPPGPR